VRTKIRWTLEKRPNYWERKEQPSGSERCKRRTTKKDTNTELLVQLEKATSTLKTQTNLARENQWTTKLLLTPA